MDTNTLSARSPNSAATPATINMARLAYPVTALGPGRRAVLWVAGCSLRCRGCITPELLDPAQGRLVEVETLAAHILNLSVPLDGLSLSGGEPFEQADALSALLDRVLTERPDWNVLAFSGYPLATLQKKDDACHRLLAHLDILIAGPYAQAQAGTQPLAASANQQIHYLTPRGTGLRSACERLPMNQANLGIGDKDNEMLIGILQPVARQALHDGLGVATP